MFIYELRGCGLEFHCCHLNFRYAATVWFWGSINQTVKCYVKANKNCMKDQFKPYMQGNIFNIYMQATFMERQWSKIYQQVGCMKRKINDFTAEKIDQLVKKDKKGYTLEVDIDYAKELHRKYDGLPFFSRQHGCWKGERTSNVS